MGAQGREDAVLEHGDAVRALGRSAAVGDKNGRLAAARPKEPIEDLRLRVRIHGGEAVVEEEHGGFPDEPPGKGRPLALAAG